MEPARKKKWRAILLLGLGFPVGYWGWKKSDFALEKISFLLVEQVQIQVPWPLTEAKVRAWIPKLEGKSILSVNANNLIKKLSEKPWVESVTIKKEYPNRIRIDIGTRRARAVQVLRREVSFLDERGKIIEPVNAEMLRSQDLPLLSFENESVQPQWDLAEVLQIFDAFHKELPNRFRISQLTLGDYPYFKAYLASQPLEVEFSLETWQAQLPRLAMLLNHPLEETRQTRRICLVLPKKAVVSSSLSH